MGGVDHCGRHGAVERQDPLIPVALLDDPVETGERPVRIRLQDEIRADVEAVVGSRLTAATAPRSGLDPGPHVRLTFASGSRLLFKCLPADHALLPRYQDEAATSEQLAGRMPVLPLHRAWQIGDWWVMAFHDLPGARYPDLSPGSPDTARALALLERLTTVVAPPMVPDAPGFVDALEGELGGWRHLQRTAADLDAWSARNLDRLTATEGCWRHYGDGTTLIHADLGPDTMLLADSGDVVTDWAYPHQGAAWITPVLFLPHLIRSGHTHQQAEDLMEASVAAWATAPPEAITFLVIALTGYWERSCRLPTAKRAPALRRHQAQMAAVGRSWIRHRTDWT